MSTKKNAPIRTWQAGDTVQGYALLTKKELRQDRNGKSFIDLELVDASGSITGKVWGDSPALTGSYEAHRFIAFRGAVKNYKEQLQLSVEDCREANDEDRRHGFDESLLVPSTREDIGDLQRRLDHLMTQVVERPVLKRLASETLAVHGLALSEHPAAKGMHHAYRGGLLEHVVSMGELAVQVAGHYRELDLDLLLVGVLFHDLGKLQELGAMPANDYTLVGRLVGHVVLGRDLLRERCAAIPDFPDDLRLHLEHLVLSHQGKKEYASPVEPMTAEALALHFIDDLDSKINQLRSARDSQPGLPYLKGLGRFMYLPALPGDEPAAPPEPLEAARQPQAPAPPAPERSANRPPLATLGALASLRSAFETAPPKAAASESTEEPRPQLLFDLEE
ncbi:MAG TPA: HD domain-containing protein [Thermoanaerobaculia bacterium]|nr:HD domain-containing protein [Thermoanaerobaculia bacterium]